MMKIPATSIEFHGMIFVGKYDYSGEANLLKSQFLPPGKLRPPRHFGGEKPNRSACP